MTALAKDTTARRWKEPGVIVSCPVAADDTIYKGAMFVLDASGNAIPLADTAAVAAGKPKSVLVALEQADNTGGAAGDINVRGQKGVVSIATSGGSAIDATDRDRTVYALDDNTVVKAAGVTNKIPVGRLHSIEDGHYFITLRDKEDSLASGVAQAIYDHADDVGVNELVAAAPYDRSVLCVAKVTETLAGTTTTPTYEVGSVTAADALGVFNAGAQADVSGIRILQGVLPAGESLDVTVTNGTGGSEAGKVQFTAIAVPL